MDELSFIPEKWIRTGDGFSVYPVSLADQLNAIGILDTGISPINPEDVQSYYDDWYFYRVENPHECWSLLKMREQEHDYIPGFADKDDPGVTVSFVEFHRPVLENLKTEAGMAAFVEEFRAVVEYSHQHHAPLLQQYFSRPEAKAPYLIARLYLEKLLSLMPSGIIPFPDNMQEAPERIIQGLKLLNRDAGRTICDFSARQLRITDPAHPTAQEKLALLCIHTGNLSFHSFAAEIRFHADALISWKGKIPLIGRRYWYESAIRADMMVERDSWFRSTFFSPYYNPSHPMVLEQIRIHGMQ